jgi:hypothetical protein
VNRARLFFTLLLSLAALLFGGHSLAGLPKQIDKRTLAPVHAFVPDAPRGEVSQVRRAVADVRNEGGGSPPPPAHKPAATGEAGDRVRNVYLMPSPGSAIGKMLSRLEGKAPIVLTAGQFEKNSAVLPKETAAPPAGKVITRVFQGKGIIEIQTASHTHLVTVELRPNVPVDQPQLQKSMGEVRRLLFQGTRPPDRIQQMPNGTFRIYSGSVQVIDPRADRLRPRADRRVVLKTPPRRGPA